MSESDKYVYVVLITFVSGYKKSHSHTQIIGVYEDAHSATAVCHQNRIIIDKMEAQNEKTCENELNIPHSGFCGCDYFIGPYIEERKLGTDNNIVYSRQDIGEESDEDPDKELFENS